MSDLPNDKTPLTTEELLTYIDGLSEKRKTILLALSIIRRAMIDGGFSPEDMGTFVKISMRFEDEMR